MSPHGISSYLWRVLAVSLTVLLGTCDVAGPKTNVVLISLDTTRADYLGAYGNERARTPVIDALAAEGFVFRNHLTPVPITLPAHTSLMTGHYPPTHTVRDNGAFVVPEGEKTLAEILTEAGYDTSAFVGAFPLHARFNLDQGFGHYDDRFDQGQLDGTRLQPKGLFFDERPAEAVVDAAIQYHRQRGRRTFFTFLHFFDPHQPLNPPPPYDLSFRDHLYDGEIAYVDAQLKRFFDFLQERGEWDRTLVLVTADHGEALGEHGELTHSMLLHQATLHIPLIVRGPGIPKGQTRRWTDATQVLATVLDYLELPHPQHDIPISSGLFPIMTDAAESEPKSSGGGPSDGGPSEGGPSEGGPFVSYFETLSPRTSQGWSQLVGYMRGDMRFIHAPKPELYDLRADPRELENLYAERPSQARSLYLGLDAFLQEKETVPVGDAFHEMDEETMERLAALGYLGDGAHLLGEMNHILELGDLPDPKDHVMEIAVFSEAKAAFAEGRWSVALRLFQQLLDSHPGHYTALRSVALIHGLMEDWDRCFEYLNRLARLKPDDRDLGLLSGQLLIQSGRTQQGIEVLENLDNANQSLEVCIWLGRAYHEAGQAPKAEFWYRRGLAIQPKQRWLRLYLANHLAESLRHPEAEAMYRDLIADFPYFSLAFYNYGRMLLDRAQPERARRLLQRAAVLHPEHVLTREALEKLGEGG